MPKWPLAYHITVGTYGTRLHGDERPTVDREHNEYGTPFLPRNDGQRRRETASLRFEPTLLTMDQRLFSEATIPSICRRGGWTYHIAATRDDHFHALLTADAEGKIVRRLLKRWLTQDLSKHWPLLIGQVWWVEDGSVKCVWTEDYFIEAYDYIAKQRTTPGPVADPLDILHGIVHPKRVLLSSEQPRTLIAPEQSRTVLSPGEGNGASSAAPRSPA